MKYLPLLFLLLQGSLYGQDNYEIQVYGAKTIEKGSTMFELHSNFTTQGFRTSVNGLLPDDLAWHETVEITQGVTDWFEIGAYLFLSGNKGNYAPAYVGNHLRPRLSAPDCWHLPVGLSLSLEAGYQRPRYSEDTWTLEIRPIIDKEYKWFYAALNPVIDYSFAGYNHHAGPQFSTDLKIEFQITGIFGFGFEYYSGFGPFKAPLPLSQQMQQVGPAFDIDVSPMWEINFGYMFGLTPGTERGIVKLILGRKADWKKLKTAARRGKT